MKIYLVSEGCYSDYRIVAVFLDEDKAKHFCKFHTDDDGHVEEFDTWDDDYKIETETMTWYEVLMYGNGTIKKIIKHKYECLPGMNNFKGQFSYDKFKSLFYGEIITDSEEQAIKIMHDNRAKYLANNFGVTV